MSLTGSSKMLDPRAGKDLDVGRGEVEKQFPCALACLRSMNFPLKFGGISRRGSREERSQPPALRLGPRDVLDLRKAVAAYLCDSRGARCHADQIVIVGAMQQAMLISALALLDPGDSAWIEDPGFKQARRVFNFVGARVVEAD